MGAVLTLNPQHGVDMSTSLTTSDGFPRADIDVAQIRTTRARIIRLKNDYKAVMKKVETAVEEHFAAGKSIDGTSTLQRSQPASVAALTASTAPAVEPPFAKVNSVTADSPASQAGLASGDRVVRFGPVNWTNHERLGKVAQTVQQHENVCQTRGEVILRLLLTWNSASDCCKGAKVRRQQRTIADTGTAAHTKARLGRAWLARMPSRTCISRQGSYRKNFNMHCFPREAKGDYEFFKDLLKSKNVARSIASRPWLKAHNAYDQTTVKHGARLDAQRISRYLVCLPMRLQNSMDYILLADCSFPRSLRAGNTRVPHLSNECLSRC